MKRFLAFALLNVWITISVWGTVPERPAEVTAVESRLHSLDLKGALPLIEKIKDPALRSFYLHHYHFLTAFVVQTPAQFQYFASQSEYLSKQIEQHAPESHPYHHFFPAEIAFERTLIKVLNRNWTAALNDLRKCYARSQKMKERPDADRFTGIFLIAFSAVPKQYKWALDVLGLEGNLEEGTRKLKRASEEAALLREQNRIILYFVYRNLLADADRTRQYVTTLYQSDPRNVLYTYLFAHNCIDRRDNAAALWAMEKWLANPSASTFPFIYNLAARSYLFKLDTQNAVKYFDLYLQYFDGVIYRTDAAYRRALCFALEGRKKEAVGSLNFAAGTGEPVFDEDKFARKETLKYLTRYFNQRELILIKGRFLLDGGYNTEGKALLDDFLKNQPAVTEDEKTEIYFRLARMYDVSKNISEAKVYYGLAFSRFPKDKLWMKVYSMLYYGMIREKAGDYSEAKRYFQTALTFDNYDYQTGLEQKAKAGLQRIKPHLKKADK